jgi:hypothetical protein
MKNTLALISAALLSAFFLSPQPLARTTQSPPQQVCYKTDSQESTVSECLNTVDCGDPKTWSCCSKTQLAMNWNGCANSPQPTGNKCSQTVTFKNFKIQNAECGGSQGLCTLGLITTSSDGRTDYNPVVSCN